MFIIMVLNLFEYVPCVVDISFNCCEHLYFHISEVLSQWSRGAYFVLQYLKHIWLFQKGLPTISKVRTNNRRVKYMMICFMGCLMLMAVALLSSQYLNAFMLSNVFGPWNHLPTCCFSCIFLCVSDIYWLYVLNKPQGSGWATRRGATQDVSPRAVCSTCFRCSSDLEEKQLRNDQHISFCCLTFAQNYKYALPPKSARWDPVIIVCALRSPGPARKLQN